MNSVGLISESIASVAGGFLAIISLRFPLYCDVFVIALTIPIALTLREPKRHRISNSESSLKNIARLIKYSLSEQKEVKWLIIYSSVVSAATLTMVWFIQPYLIANQVPLGIFGIVWAGFLVASAICSWHVQWIENFLGRKNSFVMLIVLPVAGYFLLSSFWFIWSGIFILLFYVVRGVNNPVTLDYINGLISSDVRATVLSVKNLVGRLIFSIVGPFAGWINDILSLKVALLSCGTIFLLLGLVSLFFMRRHKIF